MWLKKQTYLHIISTRLNSIYNIINLSHGPCVQLLFIFVESALNNSNWLRRPLSQPAFIFAATCPTRLRTRVMTQFKTGKRPRKLPVIALMVWPRRQSHGPSILIPRWSRYTGSSEGPVTASVFNLFSDAEREETRDLKPLLRKADLSF